MTSTIEAPTTGQRVTPTGIRILAASAPREAWLEARRAGITATDIVKIVGLSTYGSALSVATDKANAVDDDEISEAGTWGTVLEDYVAHEWAKRNGLTVRRIGILSRQGAPWMLASLDRLVGGCNGRGGSGTDGRRCGAEIKTTGIWLQQSWEDGVPPRVAAQVQWQLAVSGLDHMHVAALIGGQRLVEHTVYPDTAHQDDLIAAGALVWESIQAGVTPVIPPHLLTTDLLNEMYPERGGEKVIDGSVARQLLAEYADADAGGKAFAETKEALKVELLALLGDGEAAIDEHGGSLFTYRSQSRTSVNAKKLEADFPDAFAAVASTSSSRTFRVAKAAKS